MKDFLDGFAWHSSIGIDVTASDNKKFHTKFANTKKAREYFLTAGNNMLVHKATNALWRISDDKKSIVPVFDTDVLSEQDLKAMESK